MKHVVILTVLGMLLLLCSCQILYSSEMMSSDATDTATETQTESGTNEIMTEIQTESVATETETQAELLNPFKIYDWSDWCHDGKTIYFVDTSPTINHEEEYRVFCQYFESSLPDQFITYDQLSALGTYDCFILLEMYRDGQWKYMYDIHEEAEKYPYGCYEISVKITGLTDDKVRNIENYRSIWEEEDIYEVTDDLDDMTTNVYKDSHKGINYHDIDYHYYSNGDLYYAKLVIDNYLVQISQGSVYVDGKFEPCNFKDYAPAEPNFITLLLEGAEYEEVAESFRQMIATKAE